MDYLIFDLARLLRRSGCAVSTREIADCVQVLNVLSANQLTKYDVYTLMNATLLKTEWGAGYIQQLAELFLEPDPEILADHTGVLSPASAAARETGENEAGSGQAGSGAAVSLLTDAVLNKDPDLLYVLLRRHTLSLSLFCEDRAAALQDFKLQSGWLQVADTIEEKHRRGEILPADYHRALAGLNQWENFLKEEFERRQMLNMSRDYLSRIMKQHNPRYLHFLDAADADVAVMSRELAKLARKLAVSKGRRRQEAKQGRINISRSIRRAMPTGGVLFKLTKMSRKLTKPDICLLCDMSNSVRKFSYFMLLFVYTLQTRYSHIRSFLFVDQLLETTDYFKDRDIDSALGKIGSLKGFNLSGFSHYGNVLHQFTAHYLDVIHKSTTVLILGDAKNNWNTVDGSDVLPKIREQAKALYWLNPVQQELWDRNDCIMEKYRPSCTGVYPCANLAQLERFVIDAL